MRRLRQIHFNTRTNLERVRKIDKLLRSLAPLEDISAPPVMQCCAIGVYFSQCTCVQFVCVYCICVSTFTLHPNNVCVHWLRTGWLLGNTRQPLWRSCRSSLNKTNTESLGPVWVILANGDRQTHTPCSMLNIKWVWPSFCTEILNRVDAQFTPKNGALMFV